MRQVVGLTATIFMYLEQSGLIVAKEKEGDLVPRRLLADYARLNALKLQREQQLGLTPASRAAMRVNVLEGDDLATRAAKLRNGGE